MIIINITAITLDNTYYAIEIKQVIEDRDVLEQTHWVYAIYTKLKDCLTKQLTTMVGGYEIFNIKGFEYLVLVDKQNKNKFMSVVNNLDEQFKVEMHVTIKNKQTLYEVKEYTD